MASEKSSKSNAVKSKVKRSASSRKTSGSTKLKTDATVNPKESSVKQRAGSLEVKQKSDYQGNDWWEWSVWIEAPPKSLSQIESVEYTLHPTFPERVRRHTNRRQNFRLDSAGWGEFMIGIEIINSSGDRLRKQHWLTLEYPNPTRSISVSSLTSLSKEAADRPTIFVSAGVTDLRLGNALGDALEHQGFAVLKKENAPPGVPWDLAISSLTKKADLMVVLISGGLTSWGMREIEAAQKDKLPILPVVIGPLSLLPEQLQGFEAIPIKEFSDPIKIAPSVAQQIRQSIKH
jgi:hypothetical protein